MRSPREHLVGIATSPQGREFFSLRAEDELRMWLYVELCILGVNVSRYLEFLISLLRYPISALSTVQGIVGVDTYTGQHLFASSVEELETLGDCMRAERRAIALGCLIGASSFDANLSGIMMLVDEVMTRLDKVDGRNVNLMEEEFKVPNEEFHAPATNIEASMPAGSAYGTQEEFTVSLQPVLIEEISRWTERNIGTTYCNNTINSYNNKNSDACNKNNNVSIVSNVESQQPDSKNSFGFVESMERQREKDRLQLEIERLQLARLQAKFNEDVEAIWNVGIHSAQEEQQDCNLLQDRTIPPAPAIFPNSQPIFTIPNGSPMSVYSSGSKNGKIIDIDSLYPGSRLEAPISDVQNGELINAQDKVENNFNYNAGYNTTKDTKNWPDLISNDLWRRKGIEDNWVYLTQNVQAVGSFPIASCKPPHGSHVESPSILKLSSLPEPDEDLLTSARTHFRPIKDDGYWADGTTFPVNTAVEQVAYRRSESGNVWYLPGGESPYMEYRENDTASPVVSTISSNLTPKFRVRQCDKSIQTDPVRFAIRRKLIFDDDCYDSTPLRGEDTVISKDEEEVVIEGEKAITAQYPINKQVTQNKDTIAIDNKKISQTNEPEIELNNGHPHHNGNRKKLENEDVDDRKGYDEDGNKTEAEQDMNEHKATENEKKKKDREKCHEQNKKETENINEDGHDNNDQDQVGNDDKNEYNMNKKHDDNKDDNHETDNDDDDDEDENDDEGDDDDDNSDDGDNDDNNNDDGDGDDGDDDDDDDDDDEDDDDDYEDENNEERQVEDGEKKYEENGKEDEDEDEDEEESDDDDDDDTTVVFRNEDEKRKYILDRMYRAAVKINLADDREWRNCMNKVREKLLKKIGTDIFVTMPERIM